ncbi:MAG: hypothetical protein AAFU64_20155, partial [Bacteroidota bacterium]
FLSLSPAVFGQKNQVNFIRERHLKIREMIQDNKLYRNEFRRNAQQHKWNEAYQGQKTESYFFRLSNQQKPILTLIQVREDSLDFYYELEFLYDRLGNLLFVKEQAQHPSFPYRVLEAFFQREQLLMFSRDDVITNSSTVFESKKVRALLDKAHLYYQKFIAQFRFFPEN